MSAALPAEVFDLPGDSFLDLSRWDGNGVPAPVVLSRVEGCRITPFVIALLEAIDPAELATEDLPRLMKAWDRIESHAAAKKATVIAARARQPRVQGMGRPGAHGQRDGRALRRALTDERRCST